MVLNTYPITFATDALGTYSVAVNINDVACLGCRPRWFTATLLLPLGTTEKDLTRIWQNLCAELSKYAIQAIGGHVEIAPLVTAPVIVGQMLGETLGNNFLDMRQAQPQDKILLWRPIALEGTAILATALQKKLSTHFSVIQLKKLQNIIHNPGICIWPLVEKIVPTKCLIGIHDPTEGGLATALNEIADVCDCGLTINYAAIPIMPETKKLAQLLNFDPLGLTASGSALLVCRPHAVKSIMTKMKDGSIAIIGELTTSANKRILFRDGKKLPLPRYTTDELIKSI